MDGCIGLGGFFYGLFYHHTSLSLSLSLSLSVTARPYAHPLSHVCVFGCRCTQARMSFSLLNYFFFNKCACLFAYFFA